jgi:hypothetical protein
MNDPISTLEQKIEELEQATQGYFFVLGMIIGSQPNKELRFTRDLISAFNPSEYAIEQAEDLMTGELILKLKERKNIE